MKKIPHLLKYFPRFFLMKMIKIYQKYLSFDHSPFWKNLFPGGYCRYHPSCSEYTYQAIKKYGVFKGGLKGAWRVLRCNPFSHGGHDPLK